MKKILLSVGIIAIVAVGAIGATRAYFSDTATSTGNTFVAGIMDLQLSNGGSYSNTMDNIFAVGNMAPGEETNSANVFYKNTGSIDGKLKINVNYTENDSSDNTTNRGADMTAKQFYIKSAGLDGVMGVEYWWAQQIIAEDYSNVEATAKTDGAIVGTGLDAKPTLFGLKNLSGIYLVESLNGDAVKMGPESSHYTTLKFAMSTEADNTYQADGLNVGLTATMYQFADTTTAGF